MSDPSEYSPSSPNGLTHLKDAWEFDDRLVTFHGRPFPLEEAPFRLRQLKAWGYPLVRLTVTWESISHAGPRVEDVDKDYVAYLKQLIRLIGDYGMKTFICVHQDVWSRFTGGSGAPGWTLTAAGMDRNAFKATGAAYVHCLDDESTPKEPSGPFLWPSGYQKLSAATMMTLFWGGEVFAPELYSQLSDKDMAGPQFSQAASRQIQTFLQTAFIDAYGYLADQLADLDALIGFDLFNEPHRGLIGLENFHKWTYETDLHIGHFPSLLQSFALADGKPQAVPFYVKTWPFPTRKTHDSLIDPGGATVWRNGQCPWKSHGVWAWDEHLKHAVPLCKDYFSTDRRGPEPKPVEWYKDFYLPFIQNFSARLQKCNPDLFILLEPIPNEFFPPWPPEYQPESKFVKDKRREPPPPDPKKQQYAVKTVLQGPHPKNLVYSPHFYDLNLVFGKVWSFLSVNVQGLARGMFLPKALYLGERGLRSNYLKQITAQAVFGRQSLGNVPLLVGEIGLPYDINGAYAYKTGDYGKHVQLADAMLNALEKNLLSFTWWNFNPDAIAAHGDGWNKEDFSVITADVTSRDKANIAGETNELYRGGRILDALIRPYAVKVAGVPLDTNWDRHLGTFTLDWMNRRSQSAVTEIFFPKYLFQGKNVLIDLSDGTWCINQEAETLFVTHYYKSLGYEHHLRVTILDRCTMSRYLWLRYAKPIVANFRIWLVLLSLLFINSVFFFVLDDSERGNVKDFWKPMVHGADL